MDKNIKIIKKLLPNLKILQNVSISNYLSYHVGGPVKLFTRIYSIEDLINIIHISQNIGLEYFILGGGTNILLSDNGYKGLIIKNETSEIKISGIKGEIINKDSSYKEIYLEVDSGVMVNRLVRFCLDEGLSGLEEFLGQPGTIGGALWINAHNIKFNRYFGDNLISAKILTSSGEEKSVETNYFKFGYDQSYIQKSRDIVLKAIIKLFQKDKKLVWEKANEVMNYRIQTQPFGVFSAGCVFRNISLSDAIRISSPNHTKSVGYLLESIGVKKLTCGGARFSDKHANFIIHNGKATASDIYNLIIIAKNKIKEKYNIELEEEILLLGDF